MNNELDIKDIYPNPGQPRKEFDEGRLRELAASIEEYGVLEPIVVTPRDGRYMIIAGERRWRASQLAGRETIPARVIEADAELVEELALLENVQRQDLNPIEEAEAYQALLDRGMSKETLAAKMGFRQVWRIDERLALLRLTPGHRELVISGEIGSSQAYEMSRLGPGGQAAVLARLRRGELGTYNKLRAYVTGLLEVEAQGGLFELEPLSEEEMRDSGDLERAVAGVERLLGRMDDESLRKAAYHGRVSVERLALLIKSLQRVRKAALSGEGLREAVAV